MKSPPNGHELRRAERARVQLPVRVQLATGSPRQPAETVDISLLGARILTDEAIHPGAELRVSIPTGGCPPELGLPRTLESRAVAVRVEQKPGNRWSVAVAFQDMLAQSMEFALYMACVLDGDASLPIAQPA